MTQSAWSCRFGTASAIGPGGRGGDGAARGERYRGSGDSLDPPGPLLTHLNTIYTAYSECLPTRLNPPWEWRRLRARRRVARALIQCITMRMHDEHLDKRSWCTAQAPREGVAVRPATSHVRACCVILIFMRTASARATVTTSDMIVLHVLLLLLQSWRHSVLPTGFGVAWVFRKIAPQFRRDGSLQLKRCATARPRTEDWHLGRRTAHLG